MQRSCVSAITACYPPRLVFIHDWGDRKKGGGWHVHVLITYSRYQAVQYSRHKKRWNQALRFWCIWWIDQFDCKDIYWYQVLHGGMLIHPIQEKSFRILSFSLAWTYQGCSICCAVRYLVIGTYIDWSITKSTSFTATWPSTTICHWAFGAYCASSCTCYTRWPYIKGMPKLCGCLVGFFWSLTSIIVYTICSTYDKTS